MYINFTKMHGIFSDFMVIDRVAQTVTLSVKQIIRWANRLKGVGFDYLIVVEPPSDPEMDFTCRMFNPSGDEMDACTAGACCAAQFVYQKKLTSKKRLLIQNKERVLALYLQGRNCVQVDMGIPSFNTTKMHYSIERQLQNNNMLNKKITEPMMVSLTRSHVIVHCDDVLCSALQNIIYDTEFLSSTGEHTKVSFIQVIDKQHAKLGVWESFVEDASTQEERACAATIAFIQKGLLQSPTTIELAPRCLHIEWMGQHHPVLMTYPVITAYEGKIKL